MLDLTEDERVVLRDVLDMEIDAFEDAMHTDVEQQKPKTLDELLEAARGHADTIATLQAIRKKVIALDS